MTKKFSDTTAVIKDEIVDSDYDFDEASQLSPALETINDKVKIKNQTKSTHGKGLPLDIAMEIKILTPKQMLQRLPIALAQVKAKNTSNSLLTEIRQNVYLFIHCNEQKNHQKSNNNKIESIQIFSYG